MLERIADGAGQTQWYRCLDRTYLDAVVAQLSPGIVVSFYFDQRIAWRRYTPQVHQQILDLMVRLHALPDEAAEIVFGHLADDEVHIEVDFLAGVVRNHPH